MSNGKTVARPTKPERRNPSPRDPAAAKAWRIKRGLQPTDAEKAIRAKYEAAMADKKAAIQRISINSMKAHFEHK
jgi:hypothetical protein